MFFSVAHVVSSVSWVSLDDQLRAWFTNAYTEYSYISVGKL